LKREVPPLTYNFIPVIINFQVRPSLFSTKAKQISIFCKIRHLPLLLIKCHTFYQPLAILAPAENRSAETTSDQVLNDLLI